MHERRQYVRIPDESEITYKVLSEPKINMFFTKDLSRGGIRFFIQDAVPQNSLLEIRLTLEKIPFSFRTIVRTKWVRKVAHSERYEIGAEFVNLPEDANEYLIRYIDSLIKKNG